MEPVTDPSWMFSLLRKCWISVWQEVPIRNILVHFETFQLDVEYRLHTDLMLLLDTCWNTERIHFQCILCNLRMILYFYSRKGLHNCFSQKLGTGCRITLARFFWLILNISNDSKRVIWARSSEKQEHKNSHMNHDVDDGWRSDTSCWKLI